MVGKEVEPIGNDDGTNTSTLTLGKGILQRDNFFIVGNIHSFV